MHEVDEALERTRNTLHIYEEHCAETDGDETSIAIDQDADNNILHNTNPEIYQPTELTDPPDPPDPPSRTFAASSATEAEERIAKEGRHPDGSTPVNVPKRVWRPKVQMVYEEPEDTLDTSGDLDWLFEEHGKVGIETKGQLPPRDDLIMYNPEVHAKEIDDNVQWRVCPEEHRIVLRDIIEKFFDVFAQEGMQNHIRGFQFNIDTGQVKPICCKQPQYGPHENRVITALAEQLEKKGIIEDDHGPWGSPVVLASKPDQAHVHWSDFVFRLCISYRNLNTVTRPFTFPITRCDEAVERVGDAQYYITADLDAGYWQVEMNPASREKSAFFIAAGKKHFNSMPMGVMNAHAFFVAMLSKMEIKWNKLYGVRTKKRKEVEWEWLNAKMEAAIQTIKDKRATAEKERESNPEQAQTGKEIAEEAPFDPTWQKPGEHEPVPGSAVIVDDIILFAHTATALLYYFICMIEILQHHRVTIKLRKTRFFPARAEFVGVDISKDGNSPAQSKYDALKGLEKPLLYSDLSMLIGFIGFYRNWIPLYESRIGRWRDYNKKRPAPGAVTKEEEAQLLQNQWTEEDDELLEELKQAILDTPVLKRPVPNRRFYLKTDWSCNAQGAVLLQAGCSEEEEAALQRELNGGDCEFEKTMGGLRLLPIAFISQRRPTPSSRHSFVGEASTGRWAMLKFKRYLIGQEFTWITDCSGLLKFFETDYEATHTIQRWKLELLRFNFTIVHRPGKMLTDCDMLSRYNTWTNEWRKEETTGNWIDKHQDNKAIPATLLAMMKTDEADNGSPPIPRTHVNPKVVGANIVNRTLLASTCDRARTLWIIGTGAETATTAMTNLGLEPLPVRSTDEEEYWQTKSDAPNLQTFLSRFERREDHVEETPEWIVVPLTHSFFHSTELQDRLKETITKGKALNCKALICLWTTVDKSIEERQATDVTKWMDDIGWKTTTGQIRNEQHDGYLEGRSTYLIAANREIINRLPEQFKESNDGYHYLEQILDLGDGIFKDCFSYFTTIDEDSKPSGSGSSIKTRLDVHHGDQTKDINIFDITRVGPALVSQRHSFGNHAFAIEATDGITTQKARPIRNHELLKAYGFEQEQVTELSGEEDTQWDATFNRLKEVAPVQSWEPLLAALYSVEVEEATAETARLYCNSIQEDSTDPKRHYTDSKVLLAVAETEELLTERTNQYGNDARVFSLTEKVINRWTTLPLPTTETWIRAAEQEPDLVLVKTALQTNVTPSRSLFANKKYHTELTSQRFCLENGIIYQLEQPMATRIRQLQRKVVPSTLRPTILAAYHATPLAGHTGVYKTYWRIAARFWWPEMSRDIRKAVLECAHCRVANATSHQSQQIIGALSMDEPFDVISMDIWYPGTTQTNTTTTTNQKAILTSLDNLTGFANLAFSSQVTSEMIARLAFSHFFVPNGLPKLVIVDGGSEMKGVLIAMCEQIGIPYYQAPPEAHNSILCERFHRYLNKVQKIGAADAESYEKWAMNALFATYAWNGSPVDGTDIIRSFAAKARTFHFPLDIQTGEEIARIPEQGEATIQHLETMFPLWFRQKELLKELTKDRREHHRNLANKNKTIRTFQPGDLVLVRKQVNSNATEGKPAKLTLKARGPYRILEPAGKNSYYIQKLPAVQSLTRRPGKRMKELAMRMEKLPSSLVIHKRVDSLDTRLTEMEGDLVSNPLERNLGFYDFGKYTTAPADADFAFEKIGDLWNEEITAELHSDDEAELDSLEDSDIDQDEEMKTEETESKQARKRLRRDQIDETKTAAKRAKPNDETETTPEAFLKDLWNDIQKSADKMFLIQRPNETNKHGPASWHVVQVDSDETNNRQAKRVGEYHVKYYVRNAIDSRKRLVRNCRYWPLIREIKQPSGEFGDIIVLRPNKVAELLAKRPYTRGWYQGIVNLAENGIIGPFNFSIDQTEQHRISEEIWKAFEDTDEVKAGSVDISDLNRITPLG